MAYCQLMDPVRISTEIFRTSRQAATELLTKPVIGSPYSNTTPSPFLVFPHNQCHPEGACQQLVVAKLSPNIPHALRHAAAATAT